MIECWLCHGAGWVWRHELSTDSDSCSATDDTRYICPECDGRGQVDTEEDFL